MAETMTAVDVAPDKVQLGQRAARFCAETIKKVLSEKGSARIIVATGASQFEFLEALCTEDVAWDKVTAFHLDEYVGMDHTHKASFRRYLQERFFQKISPPCAAVHFLGGETGAVEGEAAEAACAAYESKLLEGDIDLACIGIGENGHIAFNDPPVADFNDPKMVKVVPLDEKCRQQQLGEGWFETLDNVPTHALSQTCTSIMRCKVISVHVPDERKADAVLGTLTADISTACPGTLLRRHDACYLWLDPPSASRLPDSMK
eukprot:g671.t1